MDIVYTHILRLPSSQDTAAICSIAEACECSVNQQGGKKKEFIKTSLYNRLHNSHDICGAQVSSRNIVYLFTMKQKNSWKIKDTIKYKTAPSLYLLFI
jgi:hypothetical protein